ncbi:MAG: Rieske 2Fe-2S domain-containing protein [Motiliproteus sp.]
MAQWHDINLPRALEPGEYRAVTLDAWDLLLVNLKGSYYAVENVCPHDGGELSGGTIEADTVICPRHGSSFCLKTGRVLKPPAFEDLACFVVRVNEGKLQVYDEPRWDDES